VATKNAGVRNYFMEMDLDLMPVSMPYLDASSSRRTDSGRKSVLQVLILSQSIRLDRFGSLQRYRRESAPKKK